MEGLDIPEILAPGGLLAGLAWIGLWLIRRGDRRERDAFVELKEQRDYWRSRTEEADDELAHCRHELVITRVKAGLHPSSGDEV